MSALLLTLLLLLPGCGGVDAWQSDADAHWQESDGTVYDRAAHAFDGGAVTLSPTQEANGIRTFTCTVCGFEKNESVPFTGMTESEWNAALSDTVFENFTYTETASVSMNGKTVRAEVVNCFTKDALLMTTRIGERSDRRYQTEEDAELLWEDFLASVASVFPYSAYEWNAEHRAYVLCRQVKMDLQIVELDETVEADLISGVLYFEDGKPASFTYSTAFFHAGATVTATSTVTFTDYGKTVAEDPDA